LVTANLPARRRAEVNRRAPLGVPVRGTGQNVVPGSRIPILTVVIVDYAGQDRQTAAEQVWGDWSRRYPAALVQVVHGLDQWEPLL
jgi:hypothetical protein